MSQLQYIELESGPTPNASVIWLHGLGASGDDFVPVVPELQLPDALPIRFIFPHAPERPVTVNGGYVMRAWYDILAMDLERKIDEAQIMESAAQIQALIEQEHQRGVPYSRILLIGFSQGGAVAYQAGLSYPHRLAGLAALSTYFATSETITYNKANADLPIHLFHGTNDPMVPEIMGRKALSTLQAAGFEPDYKNYPMEHAVCLEEIHDISQWIQKCLGEN